MIKIPGNAKRAKTNKKKTKLSGGIFQIHNVIYLPKNVILVTQFRSPEFQIQHFVTLLQFYVQIIAEIDKKEKKTKTKKTHDINNNNNNNNNNVNDNYE